MCVFFPFTVVYYISTKKKMLQFVLYINILVKVTIFSAASD